MPGLGGQGRGFSGSALLPAAWTLATSSAISSGRCSTWAAARQRGPRQQRGDDLRFDLTVDFEAAIFGTRPRSRFAGLRPAAPATAAAALQAAGPSPASNARAEGQCATSKASSPWPAPAAPAEATGSVIGDPCSTCRGETRVPKELKLNVKVPPGVENGTRIRYAGEGDAGRSGGPKGDLYVVLAIRPHDFFERQGQDLHCVIPISFPQAALGAEIDIPAIDGNVTIKIPEGTQSGQAIARTRQRRSLPERQRARRLDCAGAGADAPKAQPRAARTGQQASRVNGRGKQTHLAQPHGEDEGPVYLGPATANRVFCPDLRMGCIRKGGFLQRLQRNQSRWIPKPSHSSRRDPQGAAILHRAIEATGTLVSL